MVTSKKSIKVRLIIAALQPVAVGLILRVRIKVACLVQAEKKRPSADLKALAASKKLLEATCAHLLAVKAIGRVDHREAVHSVYDTPTGGGAGARPRFHYSPCIAVTCACVHTLLSHQASYEVRQNNA